MKKEKPLPKDELVHHVAAKSGISLIQAKAAIDALTETIIEKIKDGSEVRLIGFGVWKRVRVQDHSFKPIRAKHSETMPAHDKIRFIPGAILKRAVKEE